EPHGITPNLIDHLAQGDELAGSFGHLNRLAGTQKAHELYELDVEIGCSAAQRLDGGLHAFDVATVISAPHVDQVAETTIQLGLVIGDVGRKISTAAVRLLQRPVDIIAKGRRAEQSLLTVFPVLNGATFRRRQTTLVDMAVLL